jgi:hypothetical protein
MVIHACNPSYMRGIKEDWSEAGLGRNCERLYLKITKCMAGSVAQVVEHLPSKHNAKFKPQYHQRKKKRELNMSSWIGRLQLVKKSVL